MEYYNQYYNRFVALCGAYVCEQRFVHNILRLSFIYINLFASPTASNLCLIYYYEVVYYFVNIQTALLSRVVARFKYCPLQSNQIAPHTDGQTTQFLEIQNYRIWSHQASFS